MIDVLIIGGGPAGACAGAWLARNGRRVVILERDRLPRPADSPRPRVGESLLGKTMPLLHDLGLREVLARSCVLKRGAVAIWGRGDRPQELDMPGARYAYQVHRPIFDTLLLRRARELGAVVEPATRVVDLVREGSRIAGVVAETADGKVKEMRARFTLDASGLNRVVSRALNLAKTPSGPMHWSVFGHVRGAGRLPGTRENDTITEFNQRGWIWFIPLGRERTSVGFVGLDRNQVSTELWAALDAHVARTELVRGLMVGATPIGHARARAYRAEMVDAPWGDGYALAGDAHGFIDPLLSTGIHAAVDAAHWAAACIDAVLGGERDEGEVGRLYASHVRAHLQRLSALVDVIYGGGRPEGEVASVRDLAKLSPAQLDELERRLGPLSMFVLQPASEQLYLPPQLSARIRQYKAYQPRVSAVPANAVVRRSDDVDVVRSVFARRGRLVSGYELQDRSGLRPAVQVVDRSLISDALERLDRPVTVSELASTLSRRWPEEVRKLPELIGTYAQLGLVELLEQP